MISYLTSLFLNHLIVSNLGTFFSVELKLSENNQSASPECLFKAVEFSSVGKLTVTFPEDSLEISFEIS